MSEYEPKTLKKAYNKMEHGSARIAAMRGAIQAADQQGDHPFRIFSAWIYAGNPIFMTILWT